MYRYYILKLLKLILRLYHVSPINGSVTKNQHMFLNLKYGRVFHVLVNFIYGYSQILIFE